MSRRSRTRSRRVFPAVVLLLVVILTGATVLPAASYSTADVNRGASMDVVDDPNAMLALDTATGVRVGQTDQLVVVTNGLDSTAEVTVTLTDATPTNVSLVVNGTDVGDSVTVELAQTESLTVDVEVPSDAPVGEDIVFDVSADGVGIDAVASGRTVPIEENNE